MFQLARFLSLLLDEDLNHTHSQLRVQYNSKQLFNYVYELLIKKFLFSLSSDELSELFGNFICEGEIEIGELESLLVEISKEEKLVKGLKEPDLIVISKNFEDGNEVLYLYPVDIKNGHAKLKQISKENLVSCLPYLVKHGFFDKFIEDANLIMNRQIVNESRKLTLSKARNVHEIILKSCKDEVYINVNEGFVVSLFESKNSLYLCIKEPFREYFRYLIEIKNLYLQLRNLMNGYHNDLLAIICGKHNLLEVLSLLY